MPTGAIGEALQRAWDESQTLPPIVLTEKERALLVNAVLSVRAPIGENARAGHWDTAEGAEMAREYAAKARRDLIMGHLSDFVLANAQFMASRESLSLIAYQTAAKERIRWLSAQLALATPTGENAPPTSANTQGSGEIAEGGRNER